MNNMAYFRLIKKNYYLAMIRRGGIIKLLTSIELNGLPLYASANSAASVGLKNFKTTNERFGAKSLAERRKSDKFSNATIVLTYRIMRR